jgi:protein-S-isoprenylcysteine O-methyltransferase Ste14
VKELAPAVASVLAVIVFMGFVVLLFLKVIPDGMKDPLMLLAGAASAGYGQVLSYWLGSSMGSARKDDAINKLTDNKQ